MMLREMIYDFLVEKRNRERHKVMKMKWQIAELERAIASKKESVNDDRS